MKSITSETLAKIVFGISSLGFLALGVYAMIKDYAAVALFSGLFAGSISCSFWHLMKRKG